LWWSLGQLGRRLGADVFPELDVDTATDDDVLQPLLDRSMDGPALRRAATAVVASGPVFGWVTERALPEGRWRLTPPPLVEQLRSRPRLSSEDLVLTPRRGRNTMNSQLRDVAPAGDRRPDPEIIVHPSDAVTAGVVDGALATVTSANGTTTGRVRVSSELRPGTVSVPHGWTGPDVCRLTSGEDDLDSLTGMVVQSGFPVRIAPASA
jgi:hypothetical protein